MKNINKRHIQFISEYMTNGFNGKRAYMAVYPQSAESTAEVNASRLLSNAKIKAEVEKRQDILKEKYSISREKLVEDLIDIKDANKREAAQTAIKAIEVIARMLGLNEPDKTNINISEQPLFGDDDVDDEE